MPKRWQQKMEYKISIGVGAEWQQQLFGVGTKPGDYVNAKIGRSRYLSIGEIIESVLGSIAVFEMFGG